MIQCPDWLIFQISGGFASFETVLSAARNHSLFGDQNRAWYLRNSSLPCKLRIYWNKNVLLNLPLIGRFAQSTYFMFTSNSNIFFHLASLSFYGIRMYAFLGDSSLYLNVTEHTRNLDRSATLLFQCEISFVFLVEVLILL